MRLFAVGASLFAVAVMILGSMRPATAAPYRMGAADGSASLRVALTTMSPVSVGPGDTVTLAGTVTNPSDEPVDGLSMVVGVGHEVRNRNALSADLARSPGLSSTLRTVGTSSAPTSLAPGGSSPFHVSVNVHENSLDGDHATVYPLEVRFDGDSGTGLGHADTFLPYFPGSVAAPLRVVWLWPLDAAPALSTTDSIGDATVPGTFEAGGRLRGLLDLTQPPEGATGVAAQYAPVTWAVEPSLLQTAQTVARSGWTRTDGTKAQAADAAAASWLTDLRQRTDGADVIPLPYGDVDAVALVRAGLTSDLANAIALGRAQVTNALPAAHVAGVAWPPGGAVDQATVNAYVAAGATSVLINGDQLPAGDDASSPTPSAPTTIDTAGPTVRALALDPLAQQLLAGNGKDQPTARMAAQRLLALLAVVVDEQPNQLPSRDLVLAMPRNLAPDPTWARALLHDTATQQWLHPITLSDTADDPVGARQDLQPYPRAAAAAELPASSLTGAPGTVAALRKTVSQLRGMFRDDTLTRPLDQALTRAESVAWRSGEAAGRGAAQTDSRTLRDGVAARIADLLGGVRAGVAGQVTLASRHGKVPVTVENSLSEPVTVALTLNSADRTKLASPGASTYTIAAGSKQRILLPADTQRAGSFRVRLTLSTPSGLTIAVTPLVVHSSAYGTITLVITAVALAVLVIALLIRFSRRFRQWRAHPRPRASDPA